MSKWILIVLEERNEARGLTHIVSDQAFRYPNPTTGDLYVAGYDEIGFIHFLVVEQNEDDEVILRIVEDPELFDTLLTFFNDSSRQPISQQDEQLRRKMGISTRAANIQQSVAQLPITHD